MTATPRFENPSPFPFTREQYYRMGELGFFDDQRVELIYGEVIEKYPDDPADPSPRPFRYTREQFHRLGELGFFEGRRVELVCGEVVVVPPVSERHVAAVALTADALRAAFGRGHYVRVQAALSLGRIDPVPDVAVVPGGPRDYLVPPTTALLVVEVADVSPGYDTGAKCAEYATAGIADYWVLDVTGRQLHVLRDPVPLPVGLGTTAYRSHAIFSPADAVAPLAAPTASIVVADLLP